MTFPPDFCPPPLLPPPPPPAVIGALIGRQEGRNIEVMNSFELLSHVVDGHVLIDKEYYYTKEEQCEGGAGLARGGVVLSSPGAGGHDTRVVPALP